MAACGYSLGGRYFRIGGTHHKIPNVFWYLLGCPFLRSAFLAELLPYGLACLSPTLGRASIATRLPSVQLWDLVQLVLSKAQQLMPLGGAVLCYAWLEGAELLAAVRSGS